MAEEQDRFSSQDLADIYTAVLSDGVNTSIASKTLDHYILEAKAALKDDSALLDAQGVEVGIRPSYLSRLTRLEGVIDFAIDHITESLRSDEEA